MKRIFLISLLVIISCKTEYKTFYNLHKLNPKTFETESLKSNKNIIHIYSFDNNMMDKKINGFKSLTFNAKTGEKVYIETEEKNRRNYTASKSPLKHFKEFDFILDHYVKGDTEYLQSLEDSFSDAEVGSYFYIFDFRNNKVLKINAISFDSNGELIQ